MSDGTDDADPVAAFAAHVDRALRQLRIEVAELRAELDVHDVHDVHVEHVEPPVPTPTHAFVAPPEPEPEARPKPEPPRRRKLSKLRTLVSVLAGVVIAVVVLAILLVSVGPAFLPYQTYFMRSGSMEPTIRRGSIVVLTEVAASRLEIGDIITFRNPEKRSMLITHRIVAEEASGEGRVFVTKGDANRVRDPWRVLATGRSQRHWFSVPMIGYAFGFLASGRARVVLVVVPMAILLLLAALSRRRRRRQR